MYNQPNYKKEKPQFLFRGIKLNYELLKKFEFFGVDLTPPNPPEFDEQGRKTVGDGNEYGVYMTDYENVARDAYANVSIYDGTPIKKDVMFGNDKSRTMMPSVGVVYKINTDGIDAHIPWITSYLKGHYNNGMGGDEWVAESIPSSNYSIDSVVLGPDTLHESETISVDHVEEIKDELLNKIALRKKRLELFEQKIESIPEKERFLLDSTKIDVLKSIYRLNGIMDIDVNSFEPKSTSEFMDYLMAISYFENTENIDFTTMGYIKTLKDKVKVKKDMTIDDIIEKIKQDLTNNEEKKNNFSVNNPSKSTVGFDKKNAMYMKLLTKLDSKINSKEKTGYSRTESNNKVTEIQEQVLTNYEGKEIGGRTITFIDDIELGSRTITTNGEIENDDVICKMSEVSEGIGDELKKQRKEMKTINKVTGEQEQYVYQKDDTGREIYYRLADGNLTFRIIKSDRGTEIFQYDKGNLIDSFEYDNNGQAIIPMGEIETLEENFVENFFDSQVPYFEAENREIAKDQLVNTQKLGKETVDEMSDTILIDETEGTMQQQMNELSKNKDSQVK